MTFRSTLAAYTLVTLLTISAAAQTTTPVRRRAAVSPVRKNTAAAPEPAEGLAAVGDMPAATGLIKPLYALRYVDIQPGTGELAEPNKFYTVHYTGWLLNGTKFDSSHDRGEPIVFPIGARQVIIGWDTGFQGMRVGGKRRIIVPYQLAYGESGRPPVIPAKSDLVFDLELLAQSDTKPQQPIPQAPASSAPASDGSHTGTDTKPAAQPGTNPVTKPAEKPE